MSAKQFLSPAAVITIRETTPHMLRTMSFMDVARVFGAVYSVSSEVVRRCLQGENYADTAYIPPTTTLRCPRCGIRCKWCAYFYGGTEDKHDVCWRCNKKHLRRERLRAGANKQNATDRKKWRDPVEDEKHRCQVSRCGHKNINYENIYGYLKKTGYNIIVKARKKAPAPLKYQGDMYVENFSWFPHDTM